MIKGGKKRKILCFTVFETKKLRKNKKTMYGQKTIAMRETAFYF